MYQQTEKEITDQKKESESVKERLQEIRREQGRLDEEKEETKKLAETVKRQIDKLNREKHQFDILCKKYEQYETERTSLERLNKENTELTAKESALKIRMIKLQEQEIGLRALVKEISEQIDRVQKQKEKDGTYDCVIKRDLNSPNIIFFDGEASDDLQYFPTKIIQQNIG